MNDQVHTTGVDLIRRVLVVDDDHDFADSLCHFLRLEGYEAKQAYSITAAQQALDDYPAEVALIDIRMGEQSGLSLVSDFRGRSPEVTCILMTAFASADSAIEALQKGAYDYLCKPFYPETLIATLERCFERMSLARGREEAEAALRRRNRELEELNARLRMVVGSMPALSACTTLRQLCAAVLEQVAANMDARKGAVYLKEGDNLVCKHELDSGHRETIALPLPPDDPFQQVLTSRRPVFSLGPGAAAQALPAGWPTATRGALLTFPITGARQAPVGVLTVQAAEDKTFTQQDREFGLILVSLASEAIRLVQAHEQLLWSEERLREVIDNSPSLISLKDLEGRFVVVNRRFEEWHGYGPEEALGKTSQDLFPDEVAAIYAARYQEALSSGKVVEEEIEIPFADGSVHSVLVTKFPVPGAHGQPVGIGTIATDLTDRRRAEEQLRQAQKMEALGQLTGGIAHDFNNLLAVISGNLDLIQDDVADTDLSEIAEDAQAAARSGAELTHRLLAFGRRQTLRPQPTVAGKLVTGMSRMLERTLGENIQIEIALPDGLWPIDVDRNQLETSLLNLAINARDAMPDGGELTIVSRNVTLDHGYTDRHAAVDTGDYVLIAVKDSGTGMSPEVAERAIQPFFTTKEVGQGSGLGLSMVYGFAKQSGGHLEISSKLGSGTAVRLYLPRATKGAVEVETDAQWMSEANGKGERILLVEDQTDVRKLARRLLTRLGYVVFEARDGVAALSLLDDLVDVDLLFTDIMLPGGIGGEQLAREARARCPKLKVLYSSGYARSAARSINDPDGAIPLVNKPFVMKDLAGAVRRTLQAGEA
ncbi:response regulator [Pelagibius sp.]|uniref:response regulator n=1 Tax=Pelagibius sp. TaxID=1931238 RepID=UPI002629B472|nr:response regulator [Pelagibius sp.]